VILLCNQTTAPSESMANHIASLYIPSLAPEKAVTDADPATTARLRQILLDAAQGKADESRFSSSAADTVVFVKRAGPRFLGSLGLLTSFELLGTKTDAGKRSYRYRATYEKSTLVWTFVLDAGGRVVSLEPEP
jgi:hypothetical protein